MRDGRDIAIVNEIELMYLSQLNKLLIEVIDGERLIKIEEIKQLQPHLAAFCSEAKKQRATEIIQARKKNKSPCNVRSVITRASTNRTTANYNMIIIAKNNNQEKRRIKTMSNTEKFAQTERILDKHNISEYQRNVLTDIIAETEEQHGDIRKKNYAAFLMLMLSKAYTAGANNT